MHTYTRLSALAYFHIMLTAIPLAADEPKPLTEDTEEWLTWQTIDSQTATQTIHQAAFCIEDSTSLMMRQ